jgi:MinD-like ATPase involved in chromosome partitioning or flagellar assembly
MTITVLTAVVGSWEAPLVSGLERSVAGVTVVRRCADLVDLLAAAGAGLARAVVLSADLQRLDREAVAQLTALGVAVVGLIPPGDTTAARRLEQLGVDPVLPADTPAEEVADAVLTAVADLAARRADAKAQSWGIADPGAAIPAAPGGRRSAASAQPRPRPQGLMVAVWGPPGSPGRTTIAVTLAAQLAAAGQETLLVDADTHGACVAQSLGLLDESAGIAAAARAANQGSLDLARLAQLAPPVSERLRVLTGLPQSRRWPELRSSALDVVWQHARRLAAWTVIDAGFGLEADEELMFDSMAPRRHGATLSAISSADLVLAVGSADPIGLQRLFSGLPDLAAVVTAGTPVRVIITRVRDSAVGPRAEQLIREALERYAGVKDAVLIPDDRAALDGAMLLGRSLTEHAPSSPACRPLAQLAADLIQKAAPAGERSRASPRSALPRGSRRRTGLLRRRSA